METAVQSQAPAISKGAIADIAIWGFGALTLLALVALFLSATSDTMPIWALPVSVAGLVEGAMATCVAWIGKELLG